MFSIFTSSVTLKFVDFFDGFTDMHSHLLPGVDDGIRSMEETLKVLELFEEWGIREVWLTPHVMEDIPNTTADLQCRFAGLQSLYHGPVKLHLAAEYMLDDLFYERLEQNDLLPHAENRLLVETSYFNPPMDLEEIVGRIQTKWYFPLLAHPERYRYMDEPDYRLLHEAGVHFQLNLSALFGEYGETVRRKAEYLLKEGFYCCMGTDLHALAAADPIPSYRVSRKILIRLEQLKKAGEIF